MKVTCVLVAVFAVFEASAFCIDNGFSCNAFSPIQSPIVDGLQYRFLDTLSKPVTDSIKEAIRSQILKELYSISPLKRFSSSSSPLTSPLSTGKNFEVPSFQFLPSNSVTSGLLNEPSQPSQVERTGNRILSANRPGSVNYERTIGGLGGGSYPEVLNESFLGNSNGPVTEMAPSFLGNGGFLGSDRSLFQGTSSLERGLINGFSNQGY